MWLQIVDVIVDDSTVSLSLQALGQKLPIHRRCSTGGLCSGNDSNTWIRRLQLSRKLLAYGSFFSHRVVFEAEHFEGIYVLQAGMSKD